MPEDVVPHSRSYVDVLASGLSGEHAIKVLTCTGGFGEALHGPKQHTPYSRRLHFTFTSRTRRSVRLCRCQLQICASHTRGVPRCDQDRRTCFHLLLYVDADSQCATLLTLSHQASESISLSLHTPSFIRQERYNVIPRCIHVICERLHQQGS